MQFSLRISVFSISEISLCNNAYSCSNGLEEEQNDANINAINGNVKLY